jgi:hypothetical protein
LVLDHAGFKEIALFFKSIISLIQGNGFFLVWKQGFQSNLRGATAHVHM